MLWKSLRYYSESLFALTDRREEEEFKCFVWHKISLSFMCDPSKFVFLSNDPQRYKSSNHETGVSVASNTICLVYANLHDHLKSPQDLYVWVLLSSLSSAYTTCLSTRLPSVVEQLTRWLQDENCENTLLNLLHPQTSQFCKKMKPPVEPKSPFFHINWVWKCLFPLWAVIQNLILRPHKI